MMLVHKFKHEPMHAQSDAQSGPMLACHYRNSHTLYEDLLCSVSDRNGLYFRYLECVVQALITLVLISAGVWLELDYHISYRSRDIVT